MSAARRRAGRESNMCQLAMGQRAARCAPTAPCLLPACHAQASASCQLPAASCQLPAASRLSLPTCTERHIRCLVCEPGVRQRLCHPHAAVWVFLKQPPHKVLGSCRDLVPGLVVKVL